MRSRKLIITFAIIAIAMFLILVSAICTFAYNDGYRIVFPNEEYYSTSGSSWTIGKGLDYEQIAQNWLNNHFVKLYDAEESVIYPLSELGFSPAIIGLESNSIFIDERNVKIQYNIPDKVPDIIEKINEGRSTGNVGELADNGISIDIINAYESDLIDTKSLFNKIAADALNDEMYKQSNTIYVDMSEFYVYEDFSDEYSKMKNQLDAINSFSIKYTNGFDLNTEVLYNRGLLYVEDGIVKVNITDEDTRSICARNLLSYNTVGQSYTFKTHDDKEKTVNSITYGTYIDYQAEADYLVDAIKNWSSEDNRTPIFKQTADVDITKTYIEVDESKQHAYYYKDNELVWDSDVVTGKPTAERETHKGIYFIYNKAKDDVKLEKYNVIVQRWLSITYDGQGFHDASWRSSFGGNIYKTNGSHGCINTPKESMYKLYDLVSIGTPVIIY